jgi:hypothetical protein
MSEAVKQLGLVFMEPRTKFDKAIVGTVDWASGPMICYDYNEIVKIFMEDDGMSAQGATDYVDHNVISGATGAVFLTPVREDARA